MRPRPIKGLRRVVAMAHKEVLHMVRDFRVIYFSLGMPVVLLLLFGYAVSFDIENIPLAVVDQDATPASRKLVASMTASGTFRVVARPAHPGDVRALFRSGVAKVALVIPKGHHRDLKRGKRAPVQLLVDGADNTTASVATGYASAVAADLARRQLEKAGGGAIGLDGTMLDAPVRVLFNPALKSARYLVPGLMVVVMAMMAVILTALTVSREWERGSMEQLFSTPVGSLEIVLGKLIPYFIIGLIQVLLVVALGMWIFEVPMRGSFLLLMSASSLFLFAMLAQGVLISVVAKNQMIATQVSAVSTFLPALLLSGFVFPLENMPKILQVIAALFPPKYFVRCLRAIMLRGNGLDVVSVDFVAMAIFFMVILGLAVLKFQRRLA